MNVQFVSKLYTVKALLDDFQFECSMNVLGIYIMFVSDLPFLIFRVTENANKYFLKQRRLGYGPSTGFSSYLVGTWDSMFDTRPPPYRILHKTPSSDVFHGKFFKLILCVFFFFVMQCFKLTIFCLFSSRCSSFELD